jgi:hypothetical protein
LEYHVLEVVQPAGGSMIRDAQVTSSYENLL